MKTFSFAFYFCLLLMYSSCNNAPQVNKTEQLINNLESAPDTVKLLGGLYAGMTEQDIRDLTKSHPRQFYIQKVGPSSEEFLHMTMNNIDYLIFADLYKGKLYSGSYNSQKTYRKVDDQLFKEEYNKIYNLIKNANKYRKVKNSYFEKTQVEWPYSIGYKDNVEMAKFYLSSDLLNNFIIIYLDQNEDFAYSISILFAGERIPDREPTLSKQLFEIENTK